MGKFLPPHFARYDGHIGYILENPAMFENYRCPVWRDPKSCTCGSCHMYREFLEASAASDAATKNNFSSGSSISNIWGYQNDVTPKKTIQERLEAQRKANIKANDEAFERAQSLSKERPFSVTDIPNVMLYKLGWPKSAELMKKWFSLPERAMTKAEKEGDAPYVDTHTDTIMFRWQWLNMFERVGKA